MITECLAVGAGGFIGAVARYLLSLIKIGSGEIVFPATLVANVIGAFFIGFIIGTAQKNGGMDPDLMLFLKVGICGGFTTFSTFSLETVNFFNNGEPILGVGYAAISVISCLGMVALGNSVAGM